MQITETPWGRPDSVTKLAEGIYAVSTPSHGGIYLDEKANALMPMQWQLGTFRQLGCHGWYEEDCDWSLVAIIHPYAFTEQQEAHARLIARFHDHKHGIGAVSQYRRNCGRLMDSRPTEEAA
jgi:hypothetical protein